MSRHLVIRTTADIRAVRDAQILIGVLAALEANPRELPDPDGGGMFHLGSLHIDSETLWVFHRAVRQVVDEYPGVPPMAPAIAGVVLDTLRALEARRFAVDDLAGSAVPSVDDLAVGPTVADPVAVGDFLSALPQIHLDLDDGPSPGPTLVAPAAAAALPPPNSADAFGLSVEEVLSGVLDEHGVDEVAAAAAAAEPPSQQRRARPRTPLGGTPSPGQTPMPDPAIVFAPTPPIPSTPSSYDPHHVSSRSSSSPRAAMAPQPLALHDIDAMARWARANGSLPKEARDRLNAEDKVGLYLKRKAALGRPEPTWEDLWRLAQTAVRDNGGQLADADFHWIEVHAAGQLYQQLLDEALARQRLADRTLKQVLKDEEDAFAED